MSTPSNEQKAHAMTLWREAYDEVWTSRRHKERQEQYKTAVYGMMAYLGTYRTFDDLVRAYFSDELDHVCQLQCDGTGALLNAGLVEDAAFWLRLRQLQGLQQLKDGVSDDMGQDMTGEE